MYSHSLHSTATLDTEYGARSTCNANPSIHAVSVQYQRSPPPPPPHCTSTPSRVDREDTCPSRNERVSKGWKPPAEICPCARKMSMDEVDGVDGRDPWRNPVAIDANMSLFNSWISKDEDLMDGCREIPPVPSSPLSDAIPRSILCTPYSYMDTISLLSLRYQYLLL